MCSYEICNFVLAERTLTTVTYVCITFWSSSTTGIEL